MDQGLGSPGDRRDRAHWDLRLRSDNLTHAPGLSATLTGSGSALAAALAKIGLRLEKRDLPMEVLVVDRADKVPTGD